MRKLLAVEEINNCQFEHAKQAVGQLNAQFSNALQDVMNLRLRNTYEFCQTAFGKFTILYPAIYHLDKSRLQDAKRDPFLSRK